MPSKSMGYPLSKSAICSLHSSTAAKTGQSLSLAADGELGYVPIPPTGACTQILGEQVTGLMCGRRLGSDEGSCGMQPRGPGVATLKNLLRHCTGGVGGSCGWHGLFPLLNAIDAALDADLITEGHCELLLDPNAQPPTATDMAVCQTHTAYIFSWLLTRVSNTLLVKAGSIPFSRAPRHARDHPSNCKSDQPGHIFVCHSSIHFSLKRLNR
jgi:hypothetical protein